MKPGLSLMPSAAIDSGNVAGSTPPSLASALCIGKALPNSLAEPASARNSRWREYQATISDAPMPSTICYPSTVAI